MKTAVITGASRGIGSEFVVRLLDKGWRVYAGFRKEMHRLDLIEDENLIVCQLDVTDNDSIERFTQRVEHHVDLLINNAGVPDGRWRNIKEIDDQWALEVININSLGPVRLVRSLYEKMCGNSTVSYTHLRAHDTDSYLVCRLLLEKKKNLAAAWYDLDPSPLQISQRMETI